MPAKDRMLVGCPVLVRLSNLDNCLHILKLLKSVNCNFVQWIGGEICTRTKQIITGLVQKANKFETKILQLEKAN